MQTATDNPHEALPLAREALRAFRWVRCYRIRSASLLAHILVDLGKLERSEKIFLAAYRVADGCPCCLSVLHRESALLFSIRGKHAQAIARSTFAVEIGGPDKNLAILSRGIVLYNARDNRAAQVLIECLEYFPPDSSHYRLALRDIAFSLTFGSGKDLQEVSAMLPKIKKCHKGIRLLSSQRADLLWLEGSVTAAIAPECKDGVKRRKLFCDSRDSLEPAFKKYRKLEFNDKAAAAWADAVAVQTILSKTRIVKLFERIGYPTGYTDLVESIQRWALSKEKHATSELWRTLRTLRDACECGTPLVPYGTK
jgi:hypothetical protein